MGKRRCGTTQMETCPENLEYIPDSVMSNFDHEIDHDVEQKVKQGGHYADYPAWNFHGTVWFDGKFKCEIRRHHCHIATLEAETLQEIMDEASASWGMD